MLNILVVLLLVQAAQRPATPAPPPDTEIFLAPLTAAGEGLPAVGQPINISNSAGYDNQPFFTPDGKSVLFTSIRGDGKQTDIYRYDIASRTGDRVTNTTESEHTPTVT